jgi:hypothetical protein
VLIASSALYRAACDGSPLHHLFPQRNLKEAPFRPPVRGFFFSGLIAGCGEAMESPHDNISAVRAAYSFHDNHRRREPSSGLWLLPWHVPPRS